MTGEPSLVEVAGEFEGTGKLKKSIPDTKYKI